MQTYRFYRHPKGLSVGFDYVKVGFSWPAFFFDIVWMLVNQMWLRALGYLGTFVALDLLLALALFAFLQEAEAGMWLQRLEWALFAGAHLLVGLRGNAWREASLLKRGYALLSTIEAHSADAEIKRLRELASGTSLATNDA